MSFCSFILIKEKSHDIFETDELMGKAINLEAERETFDLLWLLGYVKFYFKNRKQF